MITTTGFVRVPRRSPAPPVLIALALLIAGAVSAPAQQTRPVGPFVIDARGVLARFGDQSPLAARDGLSVPEMPGKGLGFEIGGHVYPVSLGKVRLGFGGSFLWTRGTAQAVDTADKPVGPKAQLTFVSIAPQVSFNFGKHDGWSYLSGGLGFSRWTLTVAESRATAEPTPQILTINYGGGGRWFIKDHLAFTFDIRFFRLSSVTLADDVTQLPGSTRFVLAVGVSFK